MIRRLSRHALEELARVVARPVPAQQINPGVVHKFQREGLTEVVDLPSPYATHKGKRIAHLQATDAGRARLAKVC